MKSKAKAVRLEEKEEDDKELADALLNLSKKQMELDKKLRALIIIKAGE